MGPSGFSAKDDPRPEHVGDGSVGATGISKSRCSGFGGQKNFARRVPVWCLSGLSASEYPSRERKSVNIHPCDSRVGKLAVICDTDYSCGVYLFSLYRATIGSCLSINSFICYLMSSIYFFAHVCLLSMFHTHSCYFTLSAEVSTVGSGSNQ
jgi:hypothetical protein